MYIHGVTLTAVYFYTCMKEHTKSIVDEKKVTSFAEHCVEYNRSHNLDNFKILHFAKN